MAASSASLATDIEKAAKAARHTMKTVRNAKSKLGVRPRRRRAKSCQTESWEWYLPI